MLGKDFRIRPPPDKNSTFPSYSCRNNLWRLTSAEVVMLPERLGLRIPETDRVSDLADRASLEHDLTVEAVIASRRSMSQREAEIAQARKRAGTFGICEDCGEEISPQRLIAEPNAVKCIHCKEKEENWTHGGLRAARGH